MSGTATPCRVIHAGPGQGEAGGARLAVETVVGLDPTGQWLGKCWGPLPAAPHPRLRPAILPWFSLQGPQRRACHTHPACNPPSRCISLMLFHLGPGWEMVVQAWDWVSQFGDLYLRFTVCRHEGELFLHHKVLSSGSSYSYRRSCVMKPKIQLDPLWTSSIFPRRKHSVH